MAHMRRLKWGGAGVLLAFLTLGATCQVGLHIEGVRWSEGHLRPNPNQQYYLVNGAAVEATVVGDPVLSDRYEGLVFLNEGVNVVSQVWIEDDGNILKNYRTTLHDMSPVIMGADGVQSTLCLDRDLKEYTVDVRGGVVVPSTNCIPEIQAKFEVRGLPATLPGGCSLGVVYSGSYQNFPATLVRDADGVYRAEFAAEALGWKPWWDSQNSSVYVIADADCTTPLPPFDISVNGVVMEVGGRINQLACFHWDLDGTVTPDACGTNCFVDITVHGNFFKRVDIWHWVPGDFYVEEPDVMNVLGSHQPGDYPVWGVSVTAASESYVFVEDGGSNFVPLDRSAPSYGTVTMRGPLNSVDRDWVLDADDPDHGLHSAFSVGEDCRLY